VRCTTPFGTVHGLGLWLDHGGFELVAGEGADGVQRRPTRHDDDLDAGAVVADALYRRVDETMVPLSLGRTASSKWAV
jgi:hypothetical protein